MRDKIGAERLQRVPALAHRPGRAARPAATAGADQDRFCASRPLPSHTTARGSTCWCWTTREDGGTVPHMPHVLLNRLTAKPGQRQRLVEILLESGKLFDDNSACLLYLVSESTDDPNLVWVVDLWTSQQAHAEALKAPQLQPFVEQAMPLLESMPDQIEVRPVGGKGLPG
jgi:quinol monooxygenase YgiN